MHQRIAGGHGFEFVRCRHQRQAGQPRQFSRRLLGVAGRCIQPGADGGASAVIYGGLEAKGIVFDGLAEALQVPGTDVRLFGKPESFTKRRMGVALAQHADVAVARANAKLAASKVKPRLP